MWNYSAEFMNLISRRNTDCIVPENMLQAIEEGVCTKNVTGAGFLPQPFYNCVECEMNPRGNANLGICASCVKACHQGHRVFLNSVQPAFCDCGESAHCQIMDRLAKASKKELDEEDAEFGYLVCIKAFPHRMEGQRLLPATPGEIIRVKRDDIRNGIANGELHGIQGAFPLQLEYVRWINEFVIAGVDHEGATPEELSYKAKDFILVLDRLEGKAAEGKDDAWSGMRVSPNGVSSGWFHGFRTELVSAFSVEIVAKKVAAAHLLSHFLNLKENRGDAMEIVEAGMKATAAWLEISPPNGKGPAIFSCRGNYDLCLGEMQSLYASMGDFLKGRL